MNILFILNDLPYGTEGSTMKELANKALNADKVLVD